MDIKEEIMQLARNYSFQLKEQIDERKKEMQEDDTSHYLIYNVLGISDDEGSKIDEYQNTGRFLYKYTGAFLEDAATLCLHKKFPAGGKCRIDNTISTKPKTFEIDFLNGNDAIEIKWRDATTDGDHITKEKNRIIAIKNYGYKPIRVMFFYPQRKQAQGIQEALEKQYYELGGEYYTCNSAWNFILSYTGIDLKQILIDIANER